MGRIEVSGAAVDDWEAIGAGPCPSGSCLYIADIGDNNARRAKVTIYRLPEPAAGGSAAVGDVFHATYPDGPQDAETLLVTPDGDLFIVTKGETGPVGLYKFPRDLRPGATHTLERIGETVGSRAGERADRITDGAVSPDGKWVALRTRTHLTFHRLSDLTAGRWQETQARGPHALRRGAGRSHRVRPGRHHLPCRRRRRQGAAGDLRPPDLSRHPERLMSAREGPALATRYHLPVHETFMREALDEARKAEAAGEVPIGAVVVFEGVVVGRGFNRPISAVDPTAHAEILALRMAAQRGGELPARRRRSLRDARALPDVRRRAGARARADRHLRRPGAEDRRARLDDAGRWRSRRVNHRFEIVEGVLEEECRSLVQAFFKARRGSAPADQ